MKGEERRVKRIKDVGQGFSLASHLRQIANGKQQIAKMQGFFERVGLKAIFAVRPYRLPPSVHIENTNACNAHCITCPREEMTRKIGFMDISLFKRIIDECVKNGISTIHLHNFGEPFLDKRLFERIRYAKGRGIRRVKLFTNGSIMSKRVCEEVIASGLDELKVSIDGADEETFEEIRVGLKFHRVVGNIERLLEAREEMGAKRPRVGINFVLFSKNRKEEKAVRATWARKLDSISIDRWHNWGGVKSNPGPPQKRVLPCTRLWTSFTILWNGDVALCCRDFDGKVILGNVEREGIAEIYNGQRINEIRRWHLAGQFDKIEICSYCSSRE